MRKTLLLLLIFLVSFSFSGMVFADETKVKEKRIQGKISKVDCDKSMITISGVKKLRSSDKKILPDVTLKLTDKTKLTGVKECKEIKTGTVVYAGYVESVEGNKATGLILKTPLKIKDMKREGSLIPASKAK